MEARVRLREKEKIQRSRAGSFPRILITGSDDLRVARVGRVLEGLRIRLDTLGWEDSLEALAGGVAAMVLVVPIRNVAMAAAVEIVRDHPDGKALPVYVVVAEQTSSRQVRKLYRAGANAVLAWPQEREVFRNLFAESFGITRVRGRAPAAEKALAQSVRAHLRIHPELDSGRLRLFAREGLISVSGPIRSLAQRQAILDTIAAVPGVRSVIAVGLRVTATGISDRALQGRIRSLIAASSQVDAATVMVRVRNGRVLVTGIVSAEAEVQRLENLITNLDGPRALELDLRVSSRQQQADAAMTRRYRQALTTLYPKEGVSVTFIEGTAILTGEVRSLSIKRSIARLLDRDSNVRSVVDKLTVE